MILHLKLTNGKEFLSYAIFQKAKCLLKTKLLHTNIFENISNLNVNENKL